MPHIKLGVGNVVKEKSWWSVGGLLELFWAVVNFIVLLYVE